MSPRVKAYVADAAAVYGTTADRVLGKSQRAADVAARRTVWRKLQADGFSLTQIGRWTGRHHTTVLFGLRQPQRAASSAGCTHSPNRLSMEMSL